MAHILCIPLSRITHQARRSKRAQAAQWGQIVSLERAFFFSVDSHSPTQDLYDAHRHGLWTPNEAFFLFKSRTFGLGQSNWANKFWGIWGIFGQTISTHFGTVSPLSMFSIIRPLFLQKT